MLCSAWCRVSDSGPEFGVLPPGLSLTEESNGEPGARWHLHRPGPLQTAGPGVSPQLFAVSVYFCRTRKQQTLHASLRGCWARVVSLGRAGSLLFSCPVVKEAENPSELGRWLDAGQGQAGAEPFCAGFVLLLVSRFAPAAIQATQADGSDAVRVRCCGHWACSCQAGNAMVGGLPFAGRG